MKFETEGPGTITDMDNGQKLMETYSEEFNELESKRIEMGKFY